ncbi:MAG: RNA methyltransferase [Pseudomonadota bacterium]|nr:RNA methyltransferase [Pseudomonadota bacterium]
MHDICYPSAAMTKFPVSMPDPITSAANAEVKSLRALHERKYRKKSGWFLAEGARICREAVALGWDMHRLAFLAGRENDAALRPLLGGLAATGGRALPMTETLMQRISRRDNPQILVGVFGQRWHYLKAVSSTSDNIWVALDRVRDPGNLGTVMRTADAVGAAGVILVGDCTDPYSVEAVRASMGAVFNVKMIACGEAEFIAFATAWPGRVIGTAFRAAVDYRQADYGGSLIMLMGSEQAGLTTPLMNMCDKLIKIPMQGRSDSLNLAVATGIVLYTAIDQRG